MYDSFKKKPQNFYKVSFLLALHMITAPVFSKEIKNIYVAVVCKCIVRF